MAPGFIDTEMTAGLPDEVRTGSSSGSRSAAWAAREVAEVVALLATARASYVNGGIIHVDGGMYGG